MGFLIKFFELEPEFEISFEFLKSLLKNFNKFPIFNQINSWVL